jgi:hypothetical protein
MTPTSTANVALQDASHAQQAMSVLPALQGGKGRDVLAEEVPTKMSVCPAMPSALPARMLSHVHLALGIDLIHQVVSAYRGTPVMIAIPANWRATISCSGCC